jgi:xanthine dehydrogenase accessory factor
MTTLHPADAAALLVDTAEKGGSAAVATLLSGDGAAGSRMAWVETPAGEPRVEGSVGTEPVDQAVAELLREELANPRAGDGLRKLEVEGAALELYLEIRHPVLELVVVGAGHVAQPLAHVGALLGFRVTVIDDRPDFATRERFPDAHRVLRADFEDPFRDTPLHQRSHLLLVTRGHKYIGMIGSRRRVRATYLQLLEEGIDRELLDRIHAPVGLDVGAETPEEIAISVAAELVMLRRGGTGASLKDVERVADRFFKEAE